MLLNEIEFDLIVIVRLSATPCFAIERFQQPLPNEPLISAIGAKFLASGQSEHMKVGYTSVNASRKGLNE